MKKRMIISSVVIVVLAILIFLVLASFSNISGKIIAQKILSNTQNTIPSKDNTATLASSKSIPQKNTMPKIESYSCEDSDLGINDDTNQWKKGTCIRKVGEKIEKSQTDSCSDDGKSLTENFCIPQDEFPEDRTDCASTTINCSLFCSAGACNKCLDFIDIDKNFHYCEEDSYLGLEKSYSRCLHMGHEPGKSDEYYTINPYCLNYCHDDNERVKCPDGQICEIKAGYAVCVISAENDCVDTDPINKLSVLGFCIDSSEKNFIDECKTEGGKEIRQYRCDKAKRNCIMVRGSSGVSNYYSFQLLEGVIGTLPQKYQECPINQICKKGRCI